MPYHVVVALDGSEVAERVLPHVALLAEAFRPAVTLVRAFDAPTPGEVGPAVVAGHVDWTGPGVFYNLHKLVAGNEVLVTRADGSRAVFRVTRVQEYAKTAFPTAEVYGDIAYAGLRLITCGGSFNRQTGHYEDNIVAFAELVVPPTS